MAKSTISWTEETINPITGCDKLSAGCKNCYALRMIPRLKGFGLEKYRNGTDVTCHPGVMNEVLGKKKPTLYFVNSMSDTFHADVPDAFLHDMFHVMNDADQHTYIVLTKRSRRMADMAWEFEWSPNIWGGVTVESNKHLDRIAHLKEVPANVRFLSCEPLLDELVGLTPEMLDGIDWVIVGGESGTGAREMKLDWARKILATCREAGVPFFFKQVGSYGGKPKKGGNKLDGEVYEEWPDLEAAEKRGVRQVFDIVGTVNLTRE